MPIAQRMYARALFGAAQDEGNVDVVRSELDAFVGALTQSAELEAFLANPQIDSGTKAEALGQIAEGSNPLVRNFLRLVAEKGRAHEIAGIKEELDGLVDRAEGRVAVELTTAFELSDDEAAAIVGRIEESSGRTVEATRKVDPDLIGGMILQAGSLRVDASVRGRLQRLRRELVASR